MLCVINICSKYAWIVPLKNKKGITLITVVQNIFNESGRKPNKVWVDHGSEFYNRSMKSWLHDNYVEIYLTHNEWKSSVAKTFNKEIKLKSVFKGYYVFYFEKVFQNAKFHQKRKTLNCEPNRFYLVFLDR